METIPKSDCRKIGFIRKTHGVHGGVVLEYEPEYEESVAQANRFFLEIEGLLVPFYVSGDELRFKTSKSAIVAFDWVKNESQARSLTGASVFLYEQEVVDEEEDLTVSRLLEYQLFDEEGEEIGTVTAVDDYSGNMVLTIDANGREVLVPYNDELLLGIDEEKRIIKLKLPEGLLD